ncbi:MAG: hypothetical protein AB1324_03985 [Candidatus Micrarchaeota archaeon]
MRLSSGVEGKEGVEKREFSRFRGLTEGIKRTALVATISAAALLNARCGPDPGPTDSGTGGDGGVVTDGGHDSGDGGTGGDAGTSLCAQFGEGHENRATFALGDSRGPASSAVTFFAYIGKSGVGDSTQASVGGYEAPQTFPPVPFNLRVGQQRAIGTSDVGWVTVELCGTSGGACNVTAGGNVSGDQTCTATIAADKGPWGAAQ